MGLLVSYKLSAQNPTELTGKKPLMLGHFFHLPESSIPVCLCAHAHKAVLSSGSDITDSKLLQLFWWDNSAMKAQPWEGVIFWLEGLWRRGWDTKVTYRQPRRITEKLKYKTKADNVQKRNYLCYKIKRWWSMASGRNRHFTTLQFSPQKDNQGLVIVAKCRYSEPSHHWNNLTWVEGGSSSLGVF